MSRRKNQERIIVRIYSKEVSREEAFKNVIRLLLEEIYIEYGQHSTFL